MTYGPERRWMRFWVTIFEERPGSLKSHGACQKGNALPSVIYNRRFFFSEYFTSTRILGNYDDNRSNFGMISIIK